MRTFWLFIFLLVLSCQQREVKNVISNETSLRTEHIRLSTEYPSPPVLFPEASYLYFTNPSPLPCTYDISIWLNEEACQKK